MAPSAAEPFHTRPLSLNQAIKFRRSTALGLLTSHSAAAATTATATKRLLLQSGCYCFCCNQAATAAAATRLLLLLLQPAATASAACAGAPPLLAMDLSVHAPAEDTSNSVGQASFACVRSLACASSLACRGRVSLHDVLLWCCYLFAKHRMLQSCRQLLRYVSKATCCKQPKAHKHTCKERAWRA
jgi:hypothetical protein